MGIMDVVTIVWGGSLVAIMSFAIGNAALPSSHARNASGTAASPLATKARRS